MKHLLIILSILLLSSPVIGQSSKPLGVVLPPTVMGNVSNSRKQILLNTLDDELSQYFDVSPPTNVSSGDLPVVSDVFQLQIVEEDGDTQLSVRWMSGNERKIETILCGGCKTIELNGKLKELVEKLVGNKKKKEPVVYKEEIKNSEPNFQRTVNYNDGSKYVGGWKDGKSNGQGTSTYPNGNKYVGEFKDGEKHGQGTFTFSSGNKFEGEFKDDEPNGQGTFTWSDGRKYVGEYKDGKRNGQGTSTYPSGNKFEGEYKDGKKNGQGTYTWSDGSKYVGEFKDGKRWNGTSYDKDGNIIGKFVNGEWIKQ